MILSSMHNPSRWLLNGLNSFKTIQTALKRAAGFKSVLNIIIRNLSVYLVVAYRSKVVHAQFQGHSQDSCKGGAVTCRLCGCAYRSRWGHLSTHIVGWLYQTILLAGEEFYAVIAC